MLASRLRLPVCSPRMLELSAEVADLQTENAQDEAALNSLVVQVNMLTPVSI